MPVAAQWGLAPVDVVGIRRSMRIAAALQVVLVAALDDLVLLASVGEIFSFHTSQVPKALDSRPTALLWVVRFTFNGRR